MSKTILRHTLITDILLIIHMNKMKIKKYHTVAIIYNLLIYISFRANEKFVRVQYNNVGIFNLFCSSIVINTVIVTARTFEP
jgi:hypothetical protein